ncbi:predicted protein [Aspergillus terreus NIH2624]|uniref:Uncharacterized protein n=1 Tax=Aspergillus terreus (strain NIH 2624 / FGSC A1156) TaxID=341663 RepID=Q0CFL9_ASPTN|nr:uncharacterized protein ATEG_07515 [Aspergillus terreus NIH2624]EAU31777.1 predicted protein [Aspergillus terreus NIH2624]
MAMVIIFTRQVNFCQHSSIPGNPPQHWGASIPRSENISLTHSSASRTRNLISHPPPRCLSLDPGSLRDDDAIESEILQLQDQLRRVRKQRELLELRHALAEEQRLLEDVKYRLAASASHTPTTAYPPPPIDSVPMNDAQPVHGIKRSHSAVSLDDVEEHVSQVSSHDSEDNASDPGWVANWPQGDEIELSDDEDYPSSTTTSVGNESVRSDDLSVDSDAESNPSVFSWDSSSDIFRPELPFDGFFTITTRGAYRDFKRKLANHFSQYSKRFSLDKWKVREAEVNLSGGLLAEWRKAKRDETWLELHNFLLQKHSRRRGKRNGNINAMYWAARQREDQSVHNYNSYLLDLEVEMPQLLNEDQLIMKLLDGVLPEVRFAWVGPSAPHSVESDYVAMVNSLAAAERSLPKRVEKLGDKIHPPSGFKKPRT